LVGLQKIPKRVSREKSKRLSYACKAPKTLKKFLQYLEAAVGILTNYFVSNIRLFSDNPPIFTRCKDKVERSQISVGGFMHNHLNIIHSYHCDEGVAALRRF
jgi:hypothetical protein